ncbi:MAG: hypothetical protein K0R24_488 [Gammaproteobacteria bacterium]|jgi:hypothetical protein|nr:hypothetical protein [Gammaproteobacteria bacterium]
MSERENEITGPTSVIVKKKLVLPWIRRHTGLLCAVFFILLLFITSGYGYWYLIKSNERLAALTIQSNHQSQLLQANTDEIRKTMQGLSQELSQLKQSIPTPITAAASNPPVALDNSLDKSPILIKKTKRIIIFILGIILFLFYFMNLLFANIKDFFVFLGNWLRWQYRDKSYNQSIDPVADWKNLLKVLPHLYQSKTVTSAQLLMLEKKIQAELIKAIADNHPENASKVVELINQSLKKYWDADLVRLYGLLPTENPIKQLAQAERWLQHYPDQALLLLTLGRLSLRCQLWGKASYYFEESLKLNKDAKLCLEYEKLLEKLNDSAAAVQIYRDGLLS